MKKFWLASAALATAALLSVPTFAATGEELLSSADVYLTFEDGIEDVNGNYSIYSDGDTPLVEGKFGSAANIQKATNYLTVEEFTFDAESFTLTAWLNAHEFDDDPAIFGTKSWASGKNVGWVLSLEPNDIKFNANTVSGTRTDSVFTFAASPMESATDAWYHIALSVDREKEEYRFYINGTLVGQQSFAQNGHTGEAYDDLDNGYTFNIGEDGSGFYNMGEAAFNCDYDEVAVFKGKALTEEEVVAIYTYAPEGYEAAVVMESNLEPLTYTSDPEAVLASADLRITFDEGTADVNGNYTVKSTGTIGTVAGISGNGINIKNGGNYLTVEGFEVGTDSFTVTSWLNIHSSVGDPVLFGNKSWASGKNPGWLLCLVGGNSAKFNANVDGGTRTDASASFGAKCYDNWSHLALVFDRETQTYTMYVNGRQQGDPISYAENGFTDIALEAGLAFNIGDDGTGAYNSQGSIGLDVDYDEIAIFKRALTADEIAAIFCSDSPEYAAEAPVETAAPETTAPETTAPETEAPVETAAPETTAPETEAPAETAAPETEAPETAAPETTAPEVVTPAETEKAPQTFDAGIVAAAAVVVTLAGAVITKKRR